jgi:hypothetical protein
MKIYKMKSFNKQITVNSRFSDISNLDPPPISIEFLPRIFPPTRPRRDALQKYKYSQTRISDILAL